MREDQRHKQHPRLILRRPFQPFKSRPHHSIIVVHSLIRVPKPLVKQPPPNILLLILTQPCARAAAALPKLGRKVGRLQKPILIDAQLRHLGRKSIAARREAGDMVSALLAQRAEQVRLPGLDERLEAAMARDVRVVAREDGAARLGADRGLHEAVGEEGALARGEGVDVWGAHGCVACAAERVVAELVGHEDDEVGLGDGHAAWFWREA